MSIKSPENLIPNSDTDLIRDLMQERHDIVVGITEALEALPRGRSTKIDFGSLEDGRSFELSVTHQFLRGGPGPRFSDRNGFDVLSITDFLTEPGQEMPAKSPKYIITKHVPGTDMANMDPHYEISVGDSESVDGFRPIALVMQSILGSPSDIKIRGSSRTGTTWSSLFQHSLAQLQPTETAELQKTGLYVNPAEQAKLAEIKTIMALIVSQAINPDQLVMPVDLQTIAQA
jgi:hypothetical protein